MLGHPRRPSPSAENVAAARALLTRRGVLDDAFAERFVRPRKRIAFDVGSSWPGLARALSWIAVRTTLYDELVTDALDDGFRQVVILGAGYDSRGWRLARDGVSFFEVDHPGTQQRKSALAPSGGPVFVAADLSAQSLAEVLAPHLVRGEPVVFICEGLTMYLHEAAVRSLLTQAAALGGPGSQLGVEFWTPDAISPTVALQSVVMRAMQRLSGEPLRFRIDAPSVPALFRATGWVGKPTTMKADLGERLQASHLPAPAAGPIWRATSV